MKLSSSSPLGALTAIGFGTWPLSKENRPSEKEAIAIILAALESGINFIDTADAYCRDQNEMGYCERLLGKAMEIFGWDQPVVVATKGGCIRPNGAWGTNGRPEYLKKACEASLKALNVDRIELYQLHAPDPNVPFAESVGALAELQRAGKVRFLGLSNVSVDQIKIAEGIAEIVSIQNRCNPFDFGSFVNGVVSYCEKRGKQFIAYSPLGGDEEKDRTANHPVLNAFAKKYHLSPFDIAIAWLINTSPAMLPIPATTRLDHLRELTKVLDFKLDSSDQEQLNQAFHFPERKVQ